MTRVHLARIGRDQGRTYHLRIKTDRRFTTQPSFYLYRSRSLGPNSKWGSGGHWNQVPTFCVRVPIPSFAGFFWVGHDMHVHVHVHVHGECPDVGATATEGYF